MDQHHRNEKLTIQSYQRLIAAHEVHCIEKQRFSDRHFWHGGYDKATKERDRSKIGRRARLKGQVEQVMALKVIA